MYISSVKLYTCFKDSSERSVVCNRLFGNPWSSCESYHEYYARIPKKKVYLINEDDKTGTLRAAKVLKVWYGPMGNVLIYLKVAGMGYVYTTTDSDRYYMSKEAFDMGVTCSIWDETIEPIYIADKAKDHGIIEEYQCFSDKYFFIKRWKWEENHSSYTESHFAISYDVVTGIYGLVACDKDKYCYRTELDAKEANPFAVCELDDEDEEGEDKQVWVDVTTSFSFSSKMSEEEIKEKIRESFDGKNYRAFIDQKLVIDNV